MLSIKSILITNHTLYSEAVSKENHDAYFPLLKQFITSFAVDSHEEEAEEAEEIEIDTSSLTNKELYENSFDFLIKNGYITELQKDLIDLELSLHYNSPKIQAYYQYYTEYVIPGTVKTKTYMNSDCPKNSQSWLYFGNTIYCNPDDVFALMTTSSDSLGDSDDLFPLDENRIYGSKRNAPLAILYGNVEDDSFKLWNKYLIESANIGKLSYTIRYIPGDGSKERDVLGGYGVALNLKRTDYLVIDDRKDLHSEDNKNQIPSIDQDAQPNDVESVSFFDRHYSEIDTLSKSDVAMLDAKAASFILSGIEDSTSKLSKLTKLLSHIPQYTSSLVDILVDDKLLEELNFNKELGLKPGTSQIFINGITTNGLKDTIFSIFELIKKDSDLLHRLQSFSISLQDGFKLLLTNPFFSSISDQGLARYQICPETEISESIVWVNDISSDDEYSKWKGREELEHSIRPGQFYKIRENIHSYVFSLDLSEVQHLQLLSGLSRYIINNKVGLHVGFVPLLNFNNPDSEIRARFFYHLYNNNVTGDRIVSAVERLMQSKNDKIVFKKLCKIYKIPKFDMTSKDIQNKWASSREWLERLGISGPRVIVNGVVVDLNEEWPYVAGRLISTDNNRLRQAYLADEIPSDIKLSDFLLKNALSRRNTIVVPETGNLNFDSIGHPTASHNIEYILPGDANKPFISFWLIQNFGSRSGLDQLIGVLNYVKSLSAKKNIKFRFVQTTNDPFGLSVFAKLADTISNGVTDDLIGEFENILLSRYHDNDLSLHIETSSQQRPAAKKWLKAMQIGSNDITLFVDSRKIVLPTLFDDHGVDIKTLSPEDLEMLVDYETKYRIEPVESSLTNLGIKYPDNVEIDKFDWYDGIIQLLVIENEPKEDFFGIEPNNRRITLPNFKFEHAGFQIKGSDNTFIDITAVIDPLSESAQRLVPMLNAISKLSSVSIKLILNPSLTLEEMPIKRFYNGVYTTETDKLIDFSNNGKVIYPSVASFDIPDETLISLDIDSPPSWIVVPEESITDLDNILIPKNRKTVINGTYLLRNILIEGHTFDIKTVHEGRVTPPRGLAIELAIGQKSHLKAITDTSVMTNLGYFQLQGNPGLYTLRLKEGKSKNIYKFISCTSDVNSIEDEGDPSTINEDGTAIILVSDLNGATVFLKVIKRPGKERETLVDGETGNSGKGGFLSNWLKKDSPKPKQADINIFSVASGHLYERFLGIMTESVKRHTSPEHTVKYWFIENFLSPKFKQLLPYLAEKNGFDYELVTYNWPHWLRGQKEKQRTIWGYKILFLDVLFPQDLEKVIFVDADQIVRTDLKELVDLDLQGAPYGYTPMGDSREEMEGFRFWKQGYWKTFLGDQYKYHISALYVIDLIKFRAMGAGDRLRQHYQSLSADPNSLSNLDQDLPNNLQREIPIFSLPQEWLWCETWCSDESLKTAKTIDLCNNPLTKEPKLDRARRQIPEWTEYDNEIAKLEKQVHERLKLQNQLKTETSVNSSENESDDDLLHDEL